MGLTLIDIVDYCMARGDCYVAEGVIRKHVSWFAVLFHLADSQLFVARRNPGPGVKTSADVYVQRGHKVATPVFDQLQKNTTVDALESYLGASIGISENEHRPAAGQTRAPLEANIRHALKFSRRRGSASVYWRVKSTESLTRNGSKHI